TAGTWATSRTIPNTGRKAKRWRTCKNTSRTYSRTSPKATSPASARSARWLSHETCRFDQDARRYGVRPSATRREARLVHKSEDRRISARAPPSRTQRPSRPLDHQETLQQPVTPFLALPRKSVRPFDLAHPQRKPFVPFRQSLGLREPVFGVL